MVSEYHLIKFCQEISREKSWHDYRCRHEFCVGNNWRKAVKKKNKGVKYSGSRRIRNPAAARMLSGNLQVFPTIGVRGERCPVCTKLQPEAGIRSDNQCASGVGRHFCGDARSVLLNLPDRRRCPHRHKSRVGC